ncbi:hypothetical protein G6F59_015754 [Rhizopus arrhizus]|nr:hypothetical protein G6F59_015754 [Rhizopus arrhizus]
MHDVDFAFRRRLQLHALLPEVQQTFHADCEADRGRVLAAQQFDQAVVATAAADRALGAQAVGDPLENRQVVVVKAAHQARIQAEFDARVRQALAHAIEVCAGLFAQEVEQARRAVGHFLHGGVLGVQHAQRVGVQATLAVFIQDVAMLFQVLDQGGAVRGALGGLTQGPRASTSI